MCVCVHVCLSVSLEFYLCRHRFCAHIIDECVGICVCVGGWVGECRCRYVCVT